LNSSVPSIVSVPKPRDVPGASVPPELIVTVSGSTTPLPPSAPVAFTVTFDVPAITPSTCRGPPSMVVGPA
jgi:hypothetical protein